MSKLENIESAIIEAKRFIAAAEQWKEDVIKQSAEKWPAYQSKKASAAKRASMDLTRSLAVLRGRAK